MSSTQTSVNSYNEKEKMTYANLLSSLFSSFAILILSILCILNNIPLDLYGTMQLLKITVPAAVSLWFIGFFIGKIFDSNLTKQVEQKIRDEKEVYEIPSMFSGNYSAEMPEDLMNTDTNDNVLNMDDIEI